MGAIRIADGALQGRISTVFIHGPSRRLGHNGERSTQGKSYVVGDVEGGRGVTCRPSKNRRGRSLFGVVLLLGAIIIAAGAIRIADGAPAGSR